MCVKCHTGQGTYQHYNYTLYPTEAILQRHLQCNIADIRQVPGNNYLLGSYSPLQCLIW